jgi:hypothetical protein
MSFFENTKDNLKKGLDGESKIREYFKNIGINFMQADLIFFYNNKWCLAEIKTQEKYLSPPFDGHGLPQWQIDFRMKFYNDTNVEPYLIVNCLSDKCIYIQSFINLLNGEFYKTNGIKPRTIFPINSFKKIVY